MNMGESVSRAWVELVKLPFDRDGCRGILTHVEAEYGELDAYALLYAHETEEGKAQHDDDCDPVVVEG